MPATPIGENTVTSFARRYILPQVFDTVYRSNVLFFRLNKGNKRIIQGGTQIEVPFMYGRFSAGGPYRGFDVLNVSPSDTVKNGVHEWRQHYVPIAVDGLTLIKVDSPESIVNFLEFQFKQATMEMADNLGEGIYSDASNPKEIVGLEASIDDGAVATSYAGLPRATNSFLNSQVDDTTTTLNLAALQAMHGGTGVGGRHSTLIVSGQEQYNRFWALGAADQHYPVQAGGHDEQLLSAGFTNLVFNGVPWVVDDKVFPARDAANPNANSAILFLNEDPIYYAVSPRADFYLEDFQTPTDQDAMVSLLKWAGNLIVANNQWQGKMTAVAA